MDKTKQTENTKPALSSVFFDLKNILSINNMEEKKHKLNEFFTHQMAINPQNTLATIKKINMLSDRQLCYDVALAIWFPKNISALSQWLTNESSRIDLDPALKSLILTSSQVKDALFFANKISTTTVRQEEITQLFNTSLSTDTEQVISWSIEKRHDSNTWIALAFKLLNAESHLKAIKSLSYLKANNLAQVRTALQTIIDNYIFGKANTKVLLALQALEPYLIREEAIAALLPLFVNEKGLHLTDIIAMLDSLLSGETKDRLQELLALNWTDKNPNEASLFAQLLTGDSRARALSAVAESWAKKDLEAADEWLKTMDGDLDLASSSIAREAAKLGNVQISDEWLDDIIEEDIRDTAIEEAIQSYYNESPASGIYHLVYQKNLTVQKKLKLLHEIYPNEHFLTPHQALDEIGRLEGLAAAY